MMPKYFISTYYKIRKVTNMALICPCYLKKYLNKFAFYERYKKRGFLVFIDENTKIDFASFYLKNINIILSYQEKGKRFICANNYPVHHLLSTLDHLRHSPQLNGDLFGTSNHPFDGKQICIDAFQIDREIKLSP